MKAIHLRSLNSSGGDTAVLMTHRSLNSKYLRSMSLLLSISQFFWFQCGLIMYLVIHPIAPQVSDDLSVLCAIKYISFIIVSAANG